MVVESTLGVLIWMHDRSGIGLTFTDCHSQCRLDQFGGGRVVDRPAYDPAAELVQHHSTVHLALAGLDVL